MADEHVMPGHACGESLAIGPGLDHEAVGLAGQAGMAARGPPGGGRIAAPRMGGLARGQGLAAAVGTGSALMPKAARRCSRFGRAMATPRRRPAMPQIAEKVRPPLHPPRTRASAKGWPLPCRRVSSTSTTVVPGAWSGRRAVSACGVNGPGGVWLKCRGTASGASMPGGSGENRRVMATPGRAAAGPSTRRHPGPVPAGIHGGRVSPACMAWYAVAVTRTPASGVRCGRVRRGAAATLAQ